MQMTAVVDQFRRFKSLSHSALAVPSPKPRSYHVLLFALRPLAELAAGLGTHSAALRALEDLGGKALEIIAIRA